MENVYVPILLLLTRIHSSQEKRKSYPDSSLFCVPYVDNMEIMLAEFASMEETRLEVQDENDEQIRNAMEEYVLLFCFFYLFFLFGRPRVLCLEFCELTSEKYFANL